mmetsp:Transcript_20457/g.58415  ORF Transcript_20457/g.58415 Transcript_20457/m.58415 type:complete len:228 (-) Transcript_20457:636-1319(-)
MGVVVAVLRREWDEEVGEQSADVGQAVLLAIPTHLYSQAEYPQREAVETGEILSEALWELAQVTIPYVDGEVVPQPPRVTLEPRRTFNLLRIDSFLILLLCGVLPVVLCCLLDPSHRVVQAEVQEVTDWQGRVDLDSREAADAMQYGLIHTLSGEYEEVDEVQAATVLQQRHLPVDAPHPHRLRHHLTQPTALRPTARRLYRSHELRQPRRSGGRWGRRSGAATHML